MAREKQIGVPASVSTGSGTLLAVVFLTGAAVLIVEVTATRVLAPFYGNTIFTFSSVIGVILAALSCGYYIGGRQADRNPSLSRFYGIIFASGVSVLIVELLVLLLVPRIAFFFSVMTGPLLLSLLLFFVPSFLLGMLSPYAIKLAEAASPGEGIGTVSGKVFFWSTLGSIMGSIAAGFVLVPHLGVKAIILSVGIGLGLLGAAGMLRARRGIHAPAVMAGVLAVQTVGAFALSPFELRPNQAYVYRDGVYEKLVVMDIQKNGRPARGLWQDSNCAGLLYLDNGETLDYPKYFVLSDLFTSGVQNALCLGGGTYLLPQMIHDYYPNASVEVAEIEPSLFEVAQQHFGVRPSSRLKNVIMDGRRYLYDSPKKYEMIYGDVFFSLTLPPHFTTVEFFQLVRERMTPNGVFISNVVGELNHNVPNVLFSLLRTMQQVFPNSYFFAVRDPASEEPQNIVVVCVNGDKKPDLHSAAIKGHINPVIRGLAEKQLDLGRYDLAKYPLLTDDYCPVEYLAFRSIRR